MKKEEILNLLEKNNPWWKREVQIEFKDRDVFKEIKKYLHLRHIISLTGLRRTGKTTIMKKIVQESLPLYPKENIVYFSFDEAREERLMDILDIYESFMEKNLAKERFLFLFDELQKVQNWSEQLKTIYDLYPDMKFIISGSESLFIRKETRESLAGRIFEFEINPLTFKEFLSFRGKKFENLALYKKELLKELDSYMICNGFPEIVSETEEICEKYINENIIEKILFKDIPQLVPIDDISILEQIFKVILNQPGQIINFDELGKEVGISRQTASLYLDYLEKSFLIRKLYNFSKNARKTQKKSKKYYPTIILSKLLDNRELFGKAFETFVANQLDADFFWRDAYKNEVDLILTKPELTAIEIKSGELKERDLSSLEKFIKKYKPKKSFVVSYDIEKKIGNMQIIPFYKYLLEGIRAGKEKGGDGK